MRGIIECRWQPVTPITEAGRYQFRGLGVEFYNAGDETITIDRFWTIPAGGTKTIALDGPNMILILDLLIQFAGGGANPRLEVAELTVSQPGHSNYSKHGQHSEQYTFND